MEHFKKGHKDYELFKQGLEAMIRGRRHNTQLCANGRGLQSCSACSDAVICIRFKSLSDLKALYMERYNEPISTEKVPVVKTKNTK